VIENAGQGRGALFTAFGLGTARFNRGVRGALLWGCPMAKAKGGNGDNGTDDAADDAADDTGAPAPAGPVASEPPPAPQPANAGDPPAPPPAQPPVNGDKPPPDPEPEPEPEPMGDSGVLVTEQIRNEVRDALELADFVVKTGARTADGHTLSPNILKIIKVTAGNIRLFEPAGDPVHILASEWTRFELAYYALVEFTSPVTVETLRNTRNTGHFEFWNASLAQQFTWLLWFITIVFAVIVIVCGIIATGADTATKDWKEWGPTARFLNNYVPIIVPWVYGGLGACAYLLRTAHTLIAERSFDVRRKPEYLNRILLGAVSGGAIVLLFNSGSDDDTVKISAAALGFIAGYSNDLLFSAVERIVAAILPKVGLDTLKKDQVAAPQSPVALPAGGMTLKDLIDRMDGATTAEEKDLYKMLIERLSAHLPPPPGG
jgi:hypothetical protein